MWLELSIGGLVALVLLQFVAIWRLQVTIRKVTAPYPPDAFTDVPTSMLVSALDRVERRLRSLDEAGEDLPLAPAPLPVPPTVTPRMLPVMPVAPIATNYDLARELLRDGAQAEQLVERCGLSRGEAELLRSLHVASERMAADERARLAG